MKKTFLTIVAALGLLGFTSCSDMLEVESDRQLLDPEINQKTDSIFYAFGVLQAVQQAVDQYVFTGEVRGDLLKTTDYTDNNLRQLYNYSATTANKYDSAYVYYRIVNNCNYYIAHRDTTLRTGSTNVVLNEYVAMKAYRAWAYLQLARTYGKVPFFTEPLTSISQINNAHFPELDIDGIVDRLAPDLAQYAGTPVPTSGVSGSSIGRENSVDQAYNTDGEATDGNDKKLTGRYCYIPVDVILGDLYLEAGRYEEAARSFANYLIVNGSYSRAVSGSRFGSDIITPSDYNSHASYGNWASSFTNLNPSQDIVTYIPMPVNRLQGVTTELPAAFGRDYYAKTTGATTLDEIQLMPSSRFWDQSYIDFYYYTDRTLQKVKCAHLQDLRPYSYITKGNDEDSTKYWMRKYNHANVILYRGTTVWLHLAEAVNRMGYPEVAFIILKEGISTELLDNEYAFMTPRVRSFLTETLPFLSEANKSKFTQERSSNSLRIGGIHLHGAGSVSDGNYPGSSLYQLDSVAGLKLAVVAEKYNVSVGATLQDTINAVEDLLCDEYAMEFAFEGTRYPDLLRLATHKNGHTAASTYNGSPATYGADFGTRWLVEKLTPSVRDTRDIRDASILNDKTKWYLPFK